MSGSTALKPDLVPISILVSTFNGRKYLEEALESVRAQTFRDFEFVIVDDGSTDGTVGILEKFAAKDSRFRILRNPVNRGTGYSFSRLLSEVRGKYVAAIGQDDLWDPDHLQATFDALEADPAVASVFSNVRIIDSAGQPRTPESSPFDIELASRVSREELMCVLLRRNFLCAASAVFRRELIQGWHTQGDNDQLQDWNTWQHLILKGAFKALPEKKVSYRIHGANLSLGGMSPTQLQLETLQTQLAMIASRDFAVFVADSIDPDAFFLKAMTALSETINPENPSVYFGLLQALRGNEDLLRELPTFQDMLAMLFLYAGALHKAGRYAHRAISESRCPALFWRGFQSRRILMVTRTGASSKAGSFLKVTRLGSIVAVSLLARSDCLPYLGFRLDRRPLSVERLVEYQIAKGESSSRARLGRLWSLIKAGKAGHVLRSLRDRVFAS